jgi:hypothetical protein
MSWRKLGRVYAPPADGSWRHSHALSPTPLQIDSSTIRVYAAMLDSDRVGRIGYVDLAAEDPTKLIAVSDSPVLDVGEAGCFDDNGVNPLSIIRRDNLIFLYYVGWQLGVKVPYTLFVGLAVSKDNGHTFNRVTTVPILDRVEGETCVRTASHVLRRDGLWQMWYIGGSNWVEDNGKPVPSYNLRYIESEDGIHWPGPGRLVLDVEGPDEYGFGRPFLRFEDGRYKLWYSIRSFSKGYRMGYAESANGIDWTRMDDRLGLTVSSAGWDSEMICFGALEHANACRYMFYNGNRYGETGVGVAIHEPDS